MRTELFIKAEQTQALSQKMILSNEILQMGVQELCEKLGEIFLENPVVDLSQPSPEDERMAKYQWLESLNDRNRDTYMHESRREMMTGSSGRRTGNPCRTTSGRRSV